MKTRILFIEDDLMFARAVTNFLQGNDIAVTHVTMRSQALEQLRASPCDLCILDIGLPDCNGFALCKELRQITICPILILTALENEDDIVRGLQAGADDYVVKPCSLRVLHTRVLSLLRRNEWATHAMPQRLFSGQLEVDLQSATVLKNGELLQLSKVEFQLCETLILAAGQLLTRTCLLDQLCNTTGIVEDNTLSVYISRLRRKLGLYENVTYIDTVSGIGYRWNVKVRRLLR